MKKYEICIKVDTNDGDFNSVSNKISEKDLKEIKPLIKAIKKFKPYKTLLKMGGKHCHNYPYGECLREDLGERTPQELYPDIDEEVFELFEDYYPFCEYGFHTIESVTICSLPISERKKLL